MDNLDKELLKAAKNRDADRVNEILDAMGYDRTVDLEKALDEYREKRLRREDDYELNDKRTFKP